MLLVLSVAAVLLWWRQPDIAPAAPAESSATTSSERTPADPRSPPAADPSTGEVEAPAVGSGPPKPVGAVAPGPADITPPPDDERPAASFLVVDANGAPIGGATVTAIDGEHDLASGFADAAGELLLRGAAAPFDVRVTARGYLPTDGRCTDAGAVTRVVMPFAPWLRGRVFDAAGAPLCGARVQLLAPVQDRLAVPLTPQPRVPLTFTERDGRFELPWPDEQARDVAIERSGYAPFIAPSLTPAAQGERLLIVTLQPGAVVQGTAMRADGTPLALALVEVWSTTPASARPRFGERGTWREHQLLGRASTAGDGTFEVRDLPAGADIAVELAPEHGGEPWLGALAAGTVTQVELRAQELGSVRGTVADWVQPTQVFLYGGDRRLRTTFAHPDGSFEFRDVPPHVYRVGITMPPIEQTLHLVTQDWILGTNSGFATEITLAAGEQRELTLRRPAAGTGAVTGTATIAGLPATSCQVVFRPATGEGALVRRATVEADGTFGCEGLLAGDYDAELRSADGGNVLVRQPCRVRTQRAVSVTLTAP